jgi:hypothetical protein
MKRTNLFVTIGGLMGGFGLIPIAVGTAANQFPNAHISMPGWCYLACIVLAAMSPVVVGVGAKGQDTHSTASQVVASTVENPAVERQAVVDAKVAAIQNPPSTIKP